jgi:hypothetical protein
MFSLPSCCKQVGKNCQSKDQQMYGVNILMKAVDASRNGNHLNVTHLTLCKQEIVVWLEQHSMILTIKL